MPRPEKEKLVEELSGKLSHNQIAVLTDYTGLNVQAITSLREQFRKASVEYRVFKNTLARIAAKECGLDQLTDFMEGPTGYVFANDPVIPSKVLADFIKSNPNMKIKCGVINGKVINASQVQSLATLPPREVLLARLLGQMNAPITGLVTVLNGPIRKLVYALEELRKKKEAA
ncbi:MAG: 50S ribosomal protein L10 [Candidatus Abyssobacteria bacterium SURF_17]|uniref:Large ribosomal subunit protein uL10 n=1 Tax=Candidatus Abyssobacteria bacterium SURF_17 TaxID=2093361 RepID=A0A419ERM3_9BACT|nr:MAG: 50S ribosomal protein L10 [Candidatus Abyssubacteria bacterium SURF_17]